MRATIAKAVRELFTREVLQELGQFSVVKSQALRSGDRLFRWSMRKDLNAFIYLFCSPKSNEDKFTIELACSSGDFPLQMARDPKFEKGRPVRFRLPQLYKEEWPRHNWEPMWEVGPHDTPKAVITRTMVRIREGRPLDNGLLPVEETLPFVEAQVVDAVDHIKRFGIPFFESFAKQSAG